MQAVHVVKPRGCVGLDRKALSLALQRLLATAYWLSEKRFEKRLGGLACKQTPQAFEPETLLTLGIAKPRSLGRSLAQPGALNLWMLPLILTALHRDYDRGVL